MNQIQVKDTNSLLCSIPNNEPVPLVFEKIVKLEKIGVSHVCIEPNHFEELCNFGDRPPLTKTTPIVSSTTCHSQN